MGIARVMFAGSVRRRGRECDASRPNRGSEFGDGTVTRLQSLVIRNLYGAQSGIVSGAYTYA